MLKPNKIMELEIHALKEENHDYLVLKNVLFLIFIFSHKNNILLLFFIFKNSIVIFFFNI